MCIYVYVYMRICVYAHFVTYNPLCGQTHTCTGKYCTEACMASRVACLAGGNGSRNARVYADGNTFCLICNVTKNIIVKINFSNSLSFTCSTEYVGICRFRFALCSVDGPILPTPTLEKDRKHVTICLHDANPTTCIQTVTCTFAISNMFGLICKHHDIHRLLRCCPCRKDLGTKCQWPNANTQNPDTEMLSPTSNPQPQNKKVRGISYIGVLSVAFRPYTCTKSWLQLFLSFK